jgi:uncharacterized protein (TIRG00374 family)
MFSKYKKKILLSAVFGAIIFLVFSIYADFENLLDAFSKFNWLWFPVLLILAFSNYIFRFFKWQYYINILDIKLPTKTSILVFLSAFVMSVTPGKMGEVIKSYLLKEEIGTPVSKSAPIVVAERLTDFISIVLLCIVGAFVFDYGKVLLLLTGIVFISFIFMLSFRGFSLKIISFFERIKIISKHIHRIHSAYDSMYQMLKIKPLIIAIAISVIAWFFECLGFYVVLKVFASSTNVEVSLLIATFIYGFSTLVGAITMLPGGLGATEASLTGLLLLLKIPKSISVASTIIIRVATLWFAVVVGIFAVYIYQRVSNKNLESLEVVN